MSPSPTIEIADRMRVDSVEWTTAIMLGEEAGNLNKMLTFHGCMVLRVKLCISLMKTASSGTLLPRST